jgi:Transposase DDE domain group 1/Bacterial regulatory proteins, gntR family
LHRRIRNAKDTGLRNLPLHGFAQNQLWCELPAMASELLAWTAMLALEGPARAWEPKRPRLRLFTTAGRLVHGGRRLRLRLAATWPWAPHLTAAITACRPTPPADQPELSLRPGRTNSRARETPPTRRDSRETRLGQTLKTATRRRLIRTHQDRETSRLEHHVTTNTVQKALRMLKDERLVTSVPAYGTFVAEAS